MDIIYITRKKDLFDHSPIRTISLPEWSSFVANDPEMRLDNHRSVTLFNGDAYRYISPGTAVCLNRQIGHSAANEVMFDYVGGDIVIVNADDTVIDKARHIAFKLNAQIFKETNRYTVQLPVELPILKPRFRFRDALNPIKRSLPQLRYFFQHYAFSFFRNQEKVKGE